MAKELDFDNDKAKVFETMSVYRKQYLQNCKLGNTKVNEKKKKTSKYVPTDNM